MRVEQFVEIENRRRSRGRSPASVSSVSAYCALALEQPRVLDRHGDVRARTAGSIASSRSVNSATSGLNRFKQYHLFYVCFDSAYC